MMEDNNKDKKNNNDNNNDRKGYANGSIKITKFGSGFF
jgi:hypothetical protein